MTVLLGIEFSGDEALLTVVDRRGAIEAWCNEPLTAPAGDWISIHPEERVRAVVQLLERGMREGLLHGGNIAGIGLAAEPGWVLLDHDLKALPARDLPWEAVLAELPDATPAQQLAKLAELDTSLSRKTRVVLSTLDYVRFRLTGALATSVSFAWWTGLVLPQRPAEWHAPALQATGFPEDAFPPILAASERVGIIQHEISTKSGFPAGIWVHAGSDVLSSALLFATEPVDGALVCVVDDASDTPGSQVWRFGPAPEAVSGDAIPTVLGDVWLHRVVDAGWGDPRTDGAWRASSSDSPAAPVLTFREYTHLDKWPQEALADGVQVAVDAGGPTAGVALQAGFGIGWWRDRRVLWRKHLRPYPALEWCSLHDDPDAAEDPSTDG